MAEQDPSRQNGDKIAALLGNLYGGEPRATLADIMDLLPRDVSPTHSNVINTVECNHPSCFFRHLF